MKRIPQIFYMASYRTGERGYTLLQITEESIYSTKSTSVSECGTKGEERSAGWCVIAYLIMEFFVVI